MRVTINNTSDTGDPFTDDNRMKVVVVEGGAMRVSTGKSMRVGGFFLTDQGDVVTPQGPVEGAPEGRDFGKRGTPTARTIPPARTPPHAHERYPGMNHRERHERELGLSG